MFSGYWHSIGPLLPIRMRQTTSGTSAGFRGTTGPVFTGMYCSICNLREIILEDPLIPESEKNTRLAQAEVLTVYCWQVLVDSFGDIPYSQALNTVEYPLPAYDDAAAIYEDLIARLDAALSNLNGTGFETDNLYFGDVSGWEKFAASLKLRLGIRRRM